MAAEPTSHVLSIENAFRPDEIREPFSQEEALRIAVDRDQNAFRVPKVIE